MTLLANDSSGGKVMGSPERATTRDRPYDAPKQLPRPDRPWSGRSLVVALLGFMPPRCTCSFLRQQSLQCISECDDLIEQYKQDLKSKDWKPATRAVLLEELEGRLEIKAQLE